MVLHDLNIDFAWVWKLTSLFYGRRSVGTLMYPVRAAPTPIVPILIQLLGGIESVPDCICQVCVQNACKDNCRMGPSF